MKDGNSRIPALRLVALAAIAGAAAGFIGLYVMGTPAGNNAGPVLADGASTPADQACAAATETVAAVDAAAQGQVAAILAAQTPRSMADLSFNDPAGQPISIADFGGKAVLLNLWATWCAPCREEMPALDALQREMGGDEFEVVAVNIDTGSDEKPKAFLEEIGVTSLGFYRDASLDLFNDLKRQGLALGLPATLLIGENGCLLGHMNGPADWASPDAKRLVEAAL